jgi:hypothetical protein
VLSAGLIENKSGLCLFDLLVVNATLYLNMQAFHAIECRLS